MLIKYLRPTKELPIHHADQEFEEKCRCNYCKLMENILSLNDENK